MARLAQLICLFLSASVSSVNALRLHFAPPNAILQAGFPTGFRAFIPDFPGCERFSFRGKLNSPLVGNEVGSWGKDVLRPRDGFWTFEDPNAVLTPGDVLHYWTLIVKDNVPYPRTNLTWIVPDPNNSVDFVTSSTTKAPKPKPTPMKMVDPEKEETDDEEPTGETDPLDDEEPLPTLPEITGTVMEIAENRNDPVPKTEPQDTMTDASTAASSTTKAAPTAEVSSTTPSTSDSSTTMDPTTEPSTTAAPTTEPSTSAAPTTEPPTTADPTTEASTTAAPTTAAAKTSASSLTSTTTTTAPSTTEPATSEPTTTEVPTTVKPAPPVKRPTKSPISEKPKTSKPKKSTPPMANPLIAEDVEELTTPALPFEKPMATEFPQQPPLFPFPSLFPRPRPPMPPGFDICSNPWNFEEQPGESRTERLEKQVAKLQCELALSQRGTAQLGRTVENELNDLKKLIYGMVGRMARLENLLRTSAFG